MTWGRADASAANTNHVGLHFIERLGKQAVDPSHLFRRIYPETRLILRIIQHFELSQSQVPPRPVVSAPGLLLGTLTGGCSPPRTRLRGAHGQCHPCGTASPCPFRSQLASCYLEAQPKLLTAQQAYQDYELAALGNNHEEAP